MIFDNYSEAREEYTFYLLTERGETITSIANRFGCSLENIRRITNRYMRKMKVPLEIKLAAENHKEKCRKAAAWISQEHSL